MLHPQPDLRPKGNDVIVTLSHMYSAILGPVGHHVFLLGAIGVLWSTFIASTASVPRLWANNLAAFGVLDWHNVARRNKLVRIFTIVMPVIWVATYLGVKAPVFMVMIGGIGGAVFLTAGWWENFHGPELHGRTLGICGFGRIGREVAKRARGFSMEILVRDPFITDESCAAEGVTPVASIEELASRSDVLTLHLPGGQGTAVVDAELLARMPVGAVLVNAAKGDLVDEQAVAAALRSGALGGYAADAFAVEPPVASHWSTRRMWC